ncbi:MAG: hypothetical protein M3144_12395, partial [Actinomycetota bacterium]|nr:hypothetical protein [Actinomycetota bacterium]
PVLARPHRALARFVQQQGVGLVLSTLDGLATELGRHDMAALRRRVASARHHLTIEANIGRIASVYERVIGS